MGTSGHGPRSVFKAKVVDAASPITKGVKDFDQDDELYGKLQGDAPIHVLMQADSDWSKQAEPLAFTLDYGQGRVFHHTFGHDAKALNSRSENPDRSGHRVGGRKVAEGITVARRVAMVEFDWRRPGKRHATPPLVKHAEKITGGTAPRVYFLRLCGKSDHYSIARRGILGNGFALVVCLVLMSLIAILAVGLASLATIELRRSSQGNQTALAKANARLALMQAIGQLQKTLGPDQRVSARCRTFWWVIPNNRSAPACGGRPATTAAPFSPEMTWRAA